MKTAVALATIDRLLVDECIILFLGASSMGLSAHENEFCDTISELVG